MNERADRIRKALAAHGTPFGSITGVPTVAVTAVEVRLRLEWYDLDEDRSVDIAADVAALGGRVLDVGPGRLRAAWSLGEVPVSPVETPRRGRRAKSNNNSEGDKK